METQTDFLATVPVDPVRDARIIAISQFKGGVGKTTTTISLGAALCRLGFKTLLIDFDAQGNLSDSVGIDDEGDHETIADVLSRKIETMPIITISKNLHVVPASIDLASVEISMQSNVNSFFVLKNALDKIKDSYDFILIDCPPSIGVLTQAALIACDEVLIPVQAEFFSIKGLKTAYNLISTMKETLNQRIGVLGLVVTQTKHTKLTKDIVASLKQSFKDKVCTTTIRQNVALAEACAHRIDIFTYNSESFGAIDYMNLAKEIL